MQKWSHRVAKMLEFGGTVERWDRYLDDGLTNFVAKMLAGV